MKIAKNGKGVSFNDRKLAGEVRGLALKHLEKWLKKDEAKLEPEDKRFQRDLLLRLAANALPRLNEHSGPDGKPIPIYGGKSK